ncbi:hypothetical protein V2W30_20155 [Streptomyces sp. Q6]|uniref:Uncharacterized protein n=1 Tax=Streptomyces citrinus TaxID=3118173 RepID=A0ACD5ADU9_9ACTN
MTSDAPLKAKHGDVAAWEDLVARYAWVETDELDAYTVRIASPTELFGSSDAAWLP